MIYTVLIRRSGLYRFIPNFQRITIFKLTEYACFNYLVIYTLYPFIITVNAVKKYKKVTIAVGIEKCCSDN